MFPQNRIQALLATLEDASTERLSGLAVVGQSVAGHLPRRDAIGALLEARRAYLLDAAAQKYDGWRDAVLPYAETGGEYIAALAVTLAKLSENTQQTGIRAARQLHAMAFALLVTLGALIKTDQAKPRREEAPARRLTAAQWFAIARMAARVPLKLWERQSDCISAIAHPICLRSALPLPRSEFPSAAPA